ncbi:MmgE/PrpD family protein [Salinicola corii]|uniref:MmgE/PrpD family protein n=1 Tax=Salinicola corii TaxID=2606937 RepID=A0A640W9L2_9GAMM|nr:MmgE/PrpD family protein [Salinicola corii]KAA0016001.1 MmgE/PrpD family protein [Salinicola corii]
MTTPELDPLIVFSRALRFEDIPESVVAQAKRHWLDTLGAGLAGATSDIGHKVIDGLHEPGGEAVVWGTEQRLSARMAAFVNGVSAHALELDDTGGCDHSGAVVIPALLASLPLIERRVSGQELLTAMIVGYEVGRRVLEACGGYSRHNGDGWHSTGTCGVFGAAAACAKLMNLEFEALRSAITLSGSFSSGLWAFSHDGAESKKLHAGHAAQGGVNAALMARAGVVGPSQLFSDVWGGFLSTVAPGHAEPAALTVGLGQIWKLSRCSLKPYASCRGTHAAIDALSVLIRDAELDAEAAKASIQRIQVRLSPFLNDMCGTRDIDSLASAQMSLPYALAAMATLGSAGLSAYTLENRQATALRDCMLRVELIVDDQCPRDGEPEVTLITQDGRHRTLRVDTALGNPLNPLSDDALFRKFLEGAELSLSPRRCETLMRLSMGMEMLEDAGVWSQALAK